MLGHGDIAPQEFGELSPRNYWTSLLYAQHKDQSAASRVAPFGASATEALSTRRTSAIFNALRCGATTQAQGMSK